MLRRLSYNSVQSFRTALQIHFGKEVDINASTGEDREKRRKSLMDSIPNSNKGKAISLSHTDDTSVAAHSFSAKDSLGIDIEANKDINPEIKKFFVSENEEENIVKDNKDILMIWSIKEAILKADPENKGCKISQYNIEKIENGVGYGTKKADSNSKFKFLHQLTPEGYHLALAKKLREDELQKEEKKHA